jgi:transposase
MSAPLKVYVKESFSDLRTLLRRSSSLISPRINTSAWLSNRMLIQLKKHDGLLSRGKLSVMIGCCPDSIQDWRKIYLEGGIESLISHRRGGSVSTVFGEEEHEVLKETLFCPTNGIQGYTELKRLMDRRFERDFNYFSLVGYCKRNFKTKIKSSRNSHIRKDEKAVDDFKKTSILKSKIYVKR